MNHYLFHPDCPTMIPRLVATLGRAIVVLLVILTPATAQIWTAKASVGVGTLQSGGSFAINGKGYFYTDNGANNFYEYDPTANTWTAKAVCPGGVRTNAVGFSIGGKGYIGTGGGNNNFYEYDPVANTWTAKTPCNGVNRTYAVGFSIGGKGYIGTGQVSGGIVNDFQEYDPGTDSWTTKAPVPGGGRRSATGFSVNGKGYIGIGDGTGGILADMYEYNPSTNAWTAKANFPGIARYYGTSLAIGNKGYVGMGISNAVGYLNDWYEYDPANNFWGQKTNYGGEARRWAIGFAIGTRGYVGLGSNSFNKTDVWQYDPLTDPLAVRLSYFNGRMTPAGALLGWATANEQNNAWFAIERSRDRNAGTGLRFEAIGTVPTQAREGTSGTLLTYSFTDTQPPPGVNYYRLVQVDHDGTHTPSKVIALSQKGDVAYQAVLYPKPVGTSGEAVLEPALSYTRYELTDLLGQVRMQVNEPGTLSRLWVGTLPTGVYVLRVQTDGGAVVMRVIR